MEIRRRQTSAQSASESAALGKAGHRSTEQVWAVPSAQSKKEPLAALFLCAAARRIRGGTPHPPRQARHLPPLGKAWLDCGNTIPAKALKQSKLCTLHESRSDPLPSPVGEGGPRQRWMRCLRTAATGRRGTFFGFARETRLYRANQAFPGGEGVTLRVTDEGVQAAGTALRDASLTSIPHQALRASFPQGKPKIRTLLRRLPLPHSTNWRNAVGSA